jgi:phytoene dehydrogenase-like protein
MKIVPGISRKLGGSLTFPPPLAIDNGIDATNAARLISVYAACGFIANVFSHLCPTSWTKADHDHLPCRIRGRYGPTAAGFGGLGGACALEAYDEPVKRTDGAVRKFDCNEPACPAFRTAAVWPDPGPDREPVQQVMDFKQSRIGRDPADPVHPYASARRRSNRRRAGCCIFQVKFRRAAPDRYDAVIIGAGHNGLVCAFYLARAGLRVRLLERRAVVGGAAVTEEFHPGFRNSLASYTVSLLQPKVITDMQLPERGYRVVERPIANFMPQEDGGYLKIGGGLARTQAEFARFSRADAEALPRYQDTLERVADVLRGLALQRPPNLGDGWRAVLAAARQGLPLARLGLETQRDVLDLFAKSARGFLDGWFESEAIKAAVGFDAVVGNYASPDMPGSAYVLLHHVFGEVNGNRGAWGHAIGGMGAITQMMAEAAREAGAEISLESPVQRVLVDGDKAVGVKLESGEEIDARRVIANVGPRLLYERMIAPGDLDPDFRRRIATFRTGSGSFRMNLALSELPRFSCLPEPGEHHRAGIIIAPTLDYMDRAFLDAKRDGWSRQPVVEMLIPSIVDDSLAPPGAHVASLFCQQFAPELPDGRDWDDEEEEAADTIIGTVEAHAPGFRASILGRRVLSPKGLERTLGLVGGDIFHGAMTLDQIWSARPMLGHGGYRGPIAGLWMCGAGTHPGGGVTGAPGHNCAQAILSERRRFAR